MLTLEEQIERIADAAMAASPEQNHVAVVPGSARSRRRNWVGVAAAVMLIGCAGVLIGVVTIRDRPPGAADTATPEVAPVTLGQTESLSAGEWVLATVRPDGVEYLFSLAPDEDAASKTVWYGTRRTDGMGGQLQVAVGVREPLGTGEPVDVDGDTWTVSQSGTGGWTAARPVDTSAVSVSGPGLFDDTARAVLAGLVVVPESALPSEPLGPRERAVDVAATEFDGRRYRLAIQDSNGFVCTWVISTGGFSSGCGSMIDPLAPITIIGGFSDHGDGSDVFEVASAGTVTKDAARVDVEFVDGTIASATPSDLTGQFGQHFWIVAADVGPDAVSGRVTPGRAIKEARAYGADGQLIATATPP